MASRSSKVISLSLTQGVLLVVHVVSGMVFARALTVADYGTYLQTFLAYDFAVPILTLGLPSALYYFLPGAKERKKGLVLDNLLLLFFAGVIFSLFLLFGGTELLAKRFNNPDLSKTLHWMIFYPLYTFPVLINSAVWVTQEKVNLNAKYNVSTGLILTIALIVATLVTRSYELPTLVRITIPLVFLPISIYLIFRSVPGKWDAPSLSSMWNMAKFAIPLGLASVLGTITVQLGNVVVSSLTTPEDFAIYANGAKEVPFIGIITGSIGLVIMADMAKYVKEDQLSKALELFRKAAKISASFLIPIMVFLFIFSESFITILYSSKYHDSVIPFRIYLFILPVRIVYYGHAFIALGKTKAVLLRSFVELIITAVLAYILTKSIGYVGAAVATVLMYYIWAIPYNLNYLGRQFKCKATYVIPFKQIGFISTLSVIAGITSFPALFISDNPFLTLALGFIIFATVYFYISIKFLPEFRYIITSYVDKLKKYR